jgi:crossover junction endodeoxyribonuclease RusA
MQPQDRPPFEFALTLPWSRPPLTLNDRPTPYARAKLTADIRHDAAYCAIGAGLRGSMLRGVEIELIWYTGKRNIADPDNVSATLKAAIDGLRDARTLAADDGRTVVRTLQRVIPRDLDPFDSPHGRVLLVVREAASLLLPHYSPADAGQLISPVLGTPSEVG